MVQHVHVFPWRLEEPEKVEGSPAGGSAWTKVTVKNGIHAGSQLWFQSQVLLPSAEIATADWEFHSRAENQNNAAKRGKQPYGLTCVSRVVLRTGAAWPKGKKDPALFILGFWSLGFWTTLC